MYTHACESLSLCKSLCSLHTSFIILLCNGATRRPSMNTRTQGWMEKRCRGLTKFSSNRFFVSLYIIQILLLTYGNTSVIIWCTRFFFSFPADYLLQQSQSFAVSLQLTTFHLVVGSIQSSLHLPICHPLPLRSVSAALLCATTALCPGTLFSVAQTSPLGPVKCLSLFATPSQLSFPISLPLDRGDCKKRETITKKALTFSRF